jgi:hypothetical protein
MDGWEARATGILKCIICATENSYVELLKRSNDEHLIYEAKHNLSNEVRSGKFNAVFMFAVIGYEGANISYNWLFFGWALGRKQNKPKDKGYLPNT